MSVTLADALQAFLERGIYLELPVKTYFFSQDGDGHNYMIPSELRKEWNGLTANDYREEDYERWQQFNCYRLDGGIGGIEFIPTIKTI